MAELNQEVDIRPAEATAIARGLYTVARADGYVHEREAMLIADFYVGTGDHAAELSALERQGNIEAADLAEQLPSKELRELFLKTAILLAYADGTYGPQESAIIAAFATALEAGPADLEKYEAEVKDFMLSQLTHLNNHEAVVTVAKELGR